MLFSFASSFHRLFSYELCICFSTPISFLAWNSKLYTTIIRWSTHGKYFRCKESFCVCTKCTWLEIHWACACVYVCNSVRFDLDGLPFWFWRFSFFAIAIKWINVCSLLYFCFFESFQFSIGWKFDYYYFNDDHHHHRHYYLLLLLLLWISTFHHF